MNLTDSKYVLIKSILFWLIFVVLHFAYDLLGHSPIIAFFSGTSEAMYQHMKIGFYTAIILIIIESIAFRKKIEQKTSFFYSRLLGTLLIPWMIFIVWYTAPAINGPWPMTVEEVLYAQVATFLSGLIAFTLERWVSELKVPRSVQIVIWILIILSILEFTIFTFDTTKPWADVFAIPPGY